MRGMKPMLLLVPANGAEVRPVAGEAPDPLVIIDLDGIEVGVVFTLSSFGAPNARATELTGWEVRGDVLLHVPSDADAEAVMERL